MLCGREFQNSIKESVHSLLKQRAEAIGLAHHFKFLETEIINKVSGSRIFFTGLRHNIDSIKSMAGITHAWLEEANTISMQSWDTLRNTVRENGSEIFLTFNPKKETDAVYQEFCKSTIPENAYIKHVNYYDNPYFPDTLRAEMERDKVRDYGKYRHIWLGEILTNSDAQVFKTPQHWVVDKFEDDPKAFKYFGLDFGFSQDPTAGIRCYIKDNTLYVTHEAVGFKLEIDDTGQFLEDRLQDLRKYVMYADNARPESISFLKNPRPDSKQRKSYNIEPVEKGKGSVEDGIEYIKSFDKVVIHERCVHTIEEFTNYSYKVDERSGIVSTILVDEHNHCVDALRYALERCMKRRGADYSKIKVPEWMR